MSKLPTSTELYIGQFSKKDSPAPRLASPLSLTATTINVTDPLLDSNNNIVDGGFHLGIKKGNGWTETVWVPKGGVSVDGLSYTGCIRGIKPDGYDYTAGDVKFADSHNADELVFCVIPAVLPELIRSALQGLISTGGDFVMGDEDDTVTIKRHTSLGDLGFLRYNKDTHQVEYSNDGIIWMGISDSLASVVVKTSATDTTAGYVEDKLAAGDNITITKRSVGGNEHLEISSQLPLIIDKHEKYKPAYLIGGDSAESVVNLWDNIIDGEFSIVIDGNSYDITGIDFSSITSEETMDDVAMYIQNAIRAVTGGDELCEWDTTHFIIRSSNTTKDSSITTVSTVSGGVGTDISGQGAEKWMDCNVGAIILPELNPLLDGGKLPQLMPTGKLNEMFTGDALLLVAGENITVTTNPIAVYISDGSNGRTAGTFYRTDVEDLVNMGCRFVGFIKESVTTGDKAIIYTRGIIEGFNGLIGGVDYSLSNVIGEIGNVITNPNVVIGRAIDSSRLLINQQSLSVIASLTGTFKNDVVPLPTVVDVEIFTGFKAKTILATGTSSASNDISDNKGISIGNYCGGVSGCVSYIRNATHNVEGYYFPNCIYNMRKYDHSSSAAVLKVSVLSVSNNSVTVRFSDIEYFGSSNSRSNDYNIQFLIQG